ncbi:hypothetical protein HPB49_018162 [Dermacentor silvarum]|uniref:Uncharacterized protein n=1 Tax=Dermacentor silvarum TaxID=543639 RepID=A0ACB8DF23_DERSI|nr:hypothetical protein HPB49_018162 [Dermacentor silvarum]
MLKLCVLVLASVSCASSTGVSDANAYVDTILREKMPLLVRGSPQLATIGDFSFKAKEDTLATVWTTTWVNVAVRNTTAHFEASAPQGRNGTLRTFIIDHIRLHVTYDSNLSFHERRSRKFKEEIYTRVEYELMQIFQFDYKDLLSRAVESVTFPRL